MIQIVIVPNPFEPHFKAIKNVERMYKLPVTAYYPEGMEDGIYALNGAVLDDPEHTYPPDGSQIVVSPHVAGGGFKKVFGFIAMIALTVYAGHVAAGLWGKALGSAFMAGEIGATLASGAILLIGGRLVSAISGKAQMPSMNLDYDRERSQTYSWDIPAPVQSEGNIMGVTYGECIPQPQVLTQHVESVGNKQYLNLLLCGGEGPVDEITNIRIGNNDIGNYTGVEMETRLGLNDQEPISFFNNTPIDHTVDLELGDVPIVQTTQSKKAKKIEITLAWPGGLYRMKDDGNMTNTTVKFTLSYRKHGDKDWIDANKQAKIDGTWSKTVSGKTYTVNSLSGVTVHPDAPIEVWTITPVFQTRNVTVQTAGGKKTVSEKYITYTVAGSVSGQTATIIGGTDYTQGIPYDNGKVKFTISGNSKATLETYTVDLSKTAATNEGLVETYAINNLEEAQYDVRVLLTSRDKSSRASSITRWNIMTTYNDGKYARPNKVLVGLRILATNQLSGGVPSVNWRQKRSTVYVWDPKTSVYVEKSAQNPIWAAYDILHQCHKLKNINTGEYEYVVDGVSKDRFTKYWEQWLEAAAYADEYVPIPEQVQSYYAGTIKKDDVEMERRFQFDAYYDTSQKRIKAAQKAADVGHAAIISHGDDIGIAVDKPGTMTQIFGEGRTTMSSVTGTFTSLDERARSVEITYNETQNDFKNTKFTVRSQAWEDSDQDNTADQTLFGVCRRSQAWREAVYTLAQNERQTQMLEFSADIDAMVSEYGDIIGWNHSISKIGKISGRVVSVDGSTVKLDKTTDVVAGTTYQIMFQLANDALVTRSIVAEETGTFDTFTVSTPFDADAVPQQYDNYALGDDEKAVKPFRITSITRTGDMTCSVKAIEYSEALYSDDLDFSKYPIIDYTPTTNWSEVTDLKAIEQTYQQRDGSVTSSIVVSWSMDFVDYSNSYVVSVKRGDGDFKEFYHGTAQRCVIPNVNTLETYTILVQVAKDVARTQGVTTKVYITGKDSPPPDVKRFDVVQSGTNMTAVIDEVDAPDIDYYEIRQGTTWEKSTLVGVFSGSKYVFPAVNNGTITYFCKARDRSGNYSENPAIAIVAVAGLPERNVIYEQDFAPDTWTMENMVETMDGAWRIRGKKILADYDLFFDIFGGEMLVMDNGTITLPTIDLGDGMIDPADYWIDSNGYYHIRYTKTVGDFDTFASMFGANLEYRELNYLFATGTKINVTASTVGNAKYVVEYRTSIDGENWGGWMPENVTQFQGRYVQVRVTCDSLDNIGNVYVRGISVTIDVPDTEEIIENVMLSKDAPTVITFKHSFKSIRSIAVYAQDLAGKQATVFIEDSNEKEVTISVVDDTGARMSGLVQKISVRGY